MAIKNRDNLIEAIENDCDACYQYITFDGATCAIGGIAKAAGFNVKRLLESPNGNTTNIDSTGWGVGKGSLLDQMRRAIQNEFGLSFNQQRSIQIKNDSNSDLKSRRLAILEYLRTLE